MKNGPLRIVNDLDSAGRGKKRDEEEGVTRRKEGRGGRRDEESEKMKNEKVAKGRIIGLAGPCSTISGFSKIKFPYIGKKTSEWHDDI